MESVVEAIQQAGKSAPVMSSCWNLLLVCNLIPSVDLVLHSWTGVTILCWGEIVGLVADAGGRALIIKRSFGVQEQIRLSLAIRLYNAYKTSL